VVAYARVQRDAAPWPALDAVRAPRVLAAADDVLLLEAIDGVRLDRARALGALGATLARLHTTRLDAPRFARLDPGRLVTAAEVIGRVRPDAAPAAQRLLEALLERVEDGEGEPVLIHGDANLRNALLQPDGTVALLDLEDLSLGPAAADLGQLLAARVPAGPLLRGYGTPPDRAALCWHTAAAILARQALPAVSRYRPELLARLTELLDAGSALLKPKAVAA
jgi:aminoglycoside phosphotransferase (APT) family kinase protein